VTSKPPTSGWIGNEIRQTKYSREPGPAVWILGCGAYEVATFKKLEGRPNWTMEWITDDQLAKAAFERVVRSVQTQIELE
jgi:hypothetical protein